jgi:hypothetical protein
MADPIIPGGVRAQVVLQGVSGLAEDRFVNTWAFGSQDAGSPADADLDAIADALQTFYTTNPVGHTNKLEDFWAGFMDTPATINMYRLGETPPRTPIVYDFAISPGGSNPFPAEVALCLSFFSGRNLPRRRGRIYFGPLAQNGAEPGPFPEGDRRPAGSLTTCLTGAASRLASASLGLYPWAVLSGADGQLRPVTDGWVDNAFDTQRRRGVAASSRLTWS